MKGKLGGRVMKEFVALRPEMYSYLADNGYVDKKATSTRKCMTKRKTKFKNEKNYLKNDEKIRGSQQRFRSESNNVFTSKVNKIALSANDGKRL